MSVRIACPACAKPLKIAETLLGRKLTCPKCTRRIIAPTIGFSTAPNTRAYTLLCVGCGAVLTIDDRTVETPVQCSTCGSPVEFEDYPALADFREAVRVEKKAARKAEREAIREQRAALKAEKQRAKAEAKEAERAQKESEQAARRAAERERESVAAEPQAAPIAQPVTSEAPSTTGPLAVQAVPIQHPAIVQVQPAPIQESAQVAHPPRRRARGRGLTRLRNARLDDEEQLAFKQEMRRRRKSLLVAYFAWFFLGWHYAYVGQWGLQVLYWLTLGGYGFWVLIDLFRMPGIVRRYNDTMADTITTQIGVLR